MSSYQYRKSHCGDKTVVRSSYLHNGISYTGKMSSLYWIRAMLLEHCVMLPPNLIFPFPARNYWIPFDNKAVLAQLTTSCWTYGTAFSQSKLTQLPNTYMASMSWRIHDKHNCYAPSYLSVGWPRNNILQSMYEIHGLLFEQLYDHSLCYYMIKIVSNEHILQATHLYHLHTLKTV